MILYFVFFYEETAPQKLNIEEIQKIDFTGLTPEDMKVIFHDYTLVYFDEKVLPLNNAHAIFTSQYDECTVYYHYSVKDATSAFESRKLAVFNEKNSVLGKNVNNRYLITNIIRLRDEYGFAAGYYGSILIQSDKVILYIMSNADSFSKDKDEISRKNVKLIDEIITNLQNFRKTRESIKNN